MEQKIQVFIFDYRGYGKSNGTPSEAGLYLDGQAAYDFLTTIKHIPPEKIVLFGRSLGAAVAIELSLKRQIRSLIIESAFTSTKEMAKTMVLFKVFAFFFPSHFNNLEKITLITVPKLIFHGEKDEIVPFSMGQKLFQTAHQPKYFFPIKGAGHNDTYLFGGKAYFETLATFAIKSNNYRGRDH
ncbi:MAG: alpha/beta hydrolase [Deltaproteobacteria bacterium]|nr:alpha/beta hydrolase [Deltaproteobacteria bacterium]